jgi:uncharacterized protein (DUF2164 family)
LLDGPGAEYPQVAMRDKQPIEIPPVARTRAIASIQRYFREELDQDVGDLKAALLFEYFLAEHGTTIYNQGIADARAFFEERSADLAAICYQIEFPFWDRNARPDATQTMPKSGRK